MKTLLQAVIVATALTAPLAAFAQSNQGVTRAEVRAQVVQLEHVGYRPNQGNATDYPNKLQAAEARVAAQNGGTEGYGGVAAGSSASGAPVLTMPANSASLYKGH
ncbi:DUF4148 domain-containing protein [Paraburkholderia sp. BCC1886]|uniref:DUF4148 domain-containing protein n=1 Tax=Paraburkholderia sp. BCC1886 TaxID=2562670 RepID=UPI0011829D05|nr:DUF4148 domain-containing protein [Paraburkholderia sp. BCC1886]